MQLADMGKDLVRFCSRGYGNRDCLGRLACFESHSLVNNPTDADSKRIRRAKTSAG
jgi:hypothetical protein